MSDIYLVITEDRHTDTEVTPFAIATAAVEFAEQQVQENALDPDDIADEDRELNDAMKASGWLWYCRYSTEGDSVRVVRRELR